MTNEVKRPVNGTWINISNILTSGLLLGMIMGFIWVGTLNEKINHYEKTLEKLEGTNIHSRLSILEYKVDQLIGTMKKASSTRSYSPISEDGVTVAND